MRFSLPEHLIDGGEQRICRLSFEFWSLPVIERRSNIGDGKLGKVIKRLWKVIEF